VRTIPTIRNRRPLKRTPILPFLLIALALVVTFRSRSEAVATSTTTTDATIVLDTDSAAFIDGAFQVVNNESGHQTDPHVSCNLVSYTADNFQGIARVHYQDLSTGTDNVIPGNETDLFSSISGSRVAYTKVTSSGDTIRIFDTTSQTTTVVPGVKRNKPSIGGNLVVFEDHSGPGEIATYDLSTGIVTPLTNDSLIDRSPRMSPNGNAVVWEKCQINGLGCDVYAAIQTSPGVFNTRALTTDGGEDRLPSTDGEVAVYVSDRTGENDVYYQALSGNSEVHLSILGDQRNATVSGHLISFESRYLASYDIYVYDIRTGTLSRATNTLHDERLSEISVCNGVGRIVYAILENGAFDIHAFLFQAPRVTEDQIDDLISSIPSFNLPQGTTNSFIAKLQQALTAIESGDLATACSSLTALTNECAAQSGKKLTTDQATQLIVSVKQIKSVLGCQ